MASVKVEGLDDLYKRFKDVKDIDKVLKDTVKESAEFVLPKLKANTPKDSGNLQDSEKITYSNSGFTAGIGPDPVQAPYAIWVEEGHHTKSGSFVPGQHYVERTAVENQRDIKEKFVKAIRLLFNL